MIAWIYRNGLLLTILGLALGLRLLPLDYGLPFLLHEDEPIYFERALNLGLGNWDPDYFKKPSFFLYSYGALYWLISLLTYPGDWGAFVADFQTNSTTVALAGRSLTVVFALVSVWLTYRIGKRAFQNRVVGLAGALLLAIGYTHTEFSPRVISDIPALCFVLLTAWFSLCVFEKGRLKDYLACGAAMALTMSYKYNVFVGLFLLSAHLLRTGWQLTLKDIKLWAGIGLAVVLFLLLNPFIVINWQIFWADLQLEARHMLLKDLADTSREATLMAGFSKIFGRILPGALGWPLYVASLAGVAYTAWQYRRTGWILLSFVLGFLLVVSQFQLINAKYLLPVIPFLGMFAVILVHDLFTRLPVQRHASTITGWLMVLMSLPMTLKTWEHVRTYEQADTRIQAYQALTGLLQNGNTVYADPETVPLNGKALTKLALIGRWDAATHTFEMMAQGNTNTVDWTQQRPDFVLIEPATKNQLTQQQVAQHHYVLKGMFSPYQLLPLDLVLRRSRNDFYEEFRDIETKHQQRPGPRLVLLQKVPSS